MCAMDVLFRTFLTDTTVLRIHLQYGYMMIMMLFRIILKVSSCAILKKIHNKLTSRLENSDCEYISLLGAARESLRNDPEKCNIHY